MKKHHNNAQTVEQQPMSTLSQQSAAVKTNGGQHLVAYLNKLSKADLKKSRRDISFKAIPEGHYLSLCKLGKCRFRAIVVSTYMSLMWDGWTSKQKTKRIPNNKVMITKRMLHQHFNVGQSTSGLAINDLVNNQIITVARKSVFSGRQGKNLGTSYRLPWMEKPTGTKLHIYWGLLVSKPFLDLSVTLKAVIILLHLLHNRKKNRLTIQPNALEKFDVHRNRMPEYVDQLRSAGLLLYIENHDYEFAWFDQDGSPDFTRLKLKMMHPSHTDPAPRSYQEESVGAL